MVPKGWDLVQLSDIAEKVMVGIASAATHAYRTDGVRMLRNLNIKEGWIDDTDVLHIDPEYEIHHKNKRLKSGDILTVRTGYPGISAVVTDTYENAQCFTSLITRLDQSKALPHYICLHINSEYGKKFITSGEAGGAQKNVNAGMLEKMPLHLPPLPEQRKIAQILSTWDKAITTTERLLTNRQQQKKALMQRLLTGKQRFAGFEEDWKKQQIKDVVSMNYGKSPKDILDSEGIYPVIGTGGITGRSNEFLVNENAVIVGRKGTIDRPTLVKESFWAIDTVFYCLPENGIDVTWFYYWISHIDLKQYNESSGLPSLSRETIYAIKLLVPDLVEQQKIASVLSAADAEITAIQNQLDNLKQQKKALMQQLLTGKRRVKVDSPALATQ